jgi:hypothetical protein
VIGGLEEVVRMRKFPALLAIPLAIAWMSCGSVEEIYIPPKGQIEDPVAYFGMEPCTCYEYVLESEWKQSTSGFTQKLGMAVENVGMATDFGKKLHIVRYRHSGRTDRIVRQDFVDPTDPKLLLYGVNPSGRTGGEYWKMSPPPPLVSGPVQEGALVLAEAETTKHSPPDTDEEGPTTAFRAQYRNLEEVEIGVYDEIEQAFHRETVQAYPISYGGASDLGREVWNSQRRWFVPERGFVKMKMPLAGEENTWVLLHTRTLEGCTPEGAEPRDWCGR